MNFLIRNKIEEFEKSSNLTEKAIKINQAIEQIIIIFSTIFYCRTVARKIVSKRIVEIIQINLI